MEMDDEKKKYMVFRVYNKKERKDPEERAVFYGWSYDKSVIKAFFGQRDKSKYRVVKMTENEIAESFHEDAVSDDTRIDFIKLKSAQNNGEEFTIFMTPAELLESEIQIQRLFADLSSLEDKKYVDMILNLKYEYAESLYFLGYRPPEIDILFSSADENDNYCDIYGAEEKIGIAYDNMFAFTKHPDIHRPIGLGVLDDVFRRVVYSLESFIKVMKDDM